jgi:hypothetical protein
LKNQLTSELAKYRISLINIEQYSDLQEQLKQISRPNFKNFNLEEYYTNMCQNAIKEHDESITSIKNLEVSIKKIEPNFKTPISSSYFGRVGRGF